jgi:uncharacterized protein YbjT (DUF2867 family)
VRALVRDPERARAALGDGVDLARGDFDDPGSLRAAFAGAEGAFLATANHPRQLAHTLALIDVAAEAGVERVVLLSAIDAAEATATFPAQLGRAEEHLRASCPPGVVLRGNYFMTNVLASADSVRGAGAVFAPLGDCRIAMVHPRDLGEAAAAALTAPEHVGRTYTLCGPEAITHQRVADELSAAIGRPVGYVPVTPEQAGAGMRQAGMPDWLVEGVLEVHAMMRARTGERTTDDVLTLTGHAPRDFASFARERAAAFA